MINAANQIAALAYNEESLVDTVMDEAERAVFSVSERLTVSSPMYGTEEAVGSLSSVV